MDRMLPPSNILFVPSILVCCVVCVALVGCGTKPPPTGEASFRLEDPTTVVRASPERLFRSKAACGLLDEIRKLPKKTAPSYLEAIPRAEDMKELLGVDPATMERLHASLDRRKAARAVIVVALRAPCRRERFVAGMSEGAGREYRKLGLHGGIDLHGSGGDRDGAVCFPGERLVAGGTAAELKGCLADYAAGRAGTYPVPLRRALGEAPADADLVVAFVMTPGTAKELAAMGLPVDAGKVDVVTASVKAGDELDVTLQLRMKERADAARMRDQVGGFKDNPLFANETMKPLNDLLASMKVGGSGRMVRIEFKARPGIVKAAAALAGLYRTLFGGADGAGGILPGTGGDPGDW
jgi:hypothetical protein